ncbi:MAG: transposase [Gammaproteobacteria bacterium]|nr:transposase [Gammaproteobacteria bacterium]
MTAELDEFPMRHEDRRTAQGRKAAVCNGHHPERSIQTGIGPVSVRIPKVRSSDGKPATFRSSVVPPHVRKSRTLEAWLYLKGISTGEMSGVLSGLPGEQSEEFSPSAVQRLKRVWLDEMSEWQRRDLSQDSFAYVWVDGAYCVLHSEEARLCCLALTTAAAS